MAILRAYLLALWFVLFPVGLSAQDALDRLEALARENAEGYSAPLARGLAHALAGGYADQAAPLPPLAFDVGVRVLGARTPAADRTFEAVLPDSVTFAGTTYHDPYRTNDGDLESPTIAGEGAGVVLVPSGTFRDELVTAGEDPDDFRIVLPDGLGFSPTPMVALHAALGIGLGTDVSAHFLPPTEISPRVGEARAWGVSARHAVTSWIPAPLDVALTGGYHEAEAGEYLRATAWHYGVLAGVTAGPMTFFGGGQMRQASTRITYRLANDLLPENGGEMSFTTPADRDPAYLVGAHLQLLAMNISGHYAFGSYDVVSLKFGLGIR